MKTHIMIYDFYYDKWKELYDHKVLKINVSHKIGRDYALQPLFFLFISFLVSVKKL